MENMEGKSRDVLQRTKGEKQSSLFDQFERESFEATLNQALLLGRSFSAPNAPRLLANAQPFLFSLQQPQHHQRQQQQQPSRRCRLSKALKKLLKPFLLQKHRRSKDPDADDLKARRAFSRSCRA